MKFIKNTFKLTVFSFILYYAVISKDVYIVYAIDTDCSSDLDSSGSTYTLTGNTSGNCTD